MPKIKLPDFDDNLSFEESFGLFTDFMKKQDDDFHNVCKNLKYLNPENSVSAATTKDETSQVEGRHGEGSSTGDHALVMRHKDTVSPSPPEPFLAPGSTENAYDGDMKHVLDISSLFDPPEQACTMSPSTPDDFSLPGTPGRSELQPAPDAMITKYADVSRIVDPCFELCDIVSPPAPAPFRFSSPQETCYMDIHSDSPPAPASFRYSSPQENCVMNIHSDSPSPPDPFLYHSPPDNCSIDSEAGSATGVTSYEMEETEDAAEEDIDFVVNEFLTGKYKVQSPPPLPETQSPSTDCIPLLQLIVTVYEILERSQRTERRSIKHRITKRLSSIFCCGKKEF